VNGRLLKRWGEGSWHAKRKAKMELEKCNCGEDGQWFAGWSLKGHPRKEQEGAKEDVLTLVDHG